MSRRRKKGFFEQLFSVIGLILGTLIGAIIGGIIELIWRVTTNTWPEKK